MARKSKKLVEKKSYNPLKFLKKSVQKYGLILGSLWVLSLLIVAPIVFVYGGWVAVVAYLGCKLSGVCPI